MLSEQWLKSEYCMTSPCICHYLGYFPQSTSHPCRLDAQHHPVFGIVSFAGASVKLRTCFKGLQGSSEIILVLRKFEGFETCDVFVSYFLFVYLQYLCLFKIFIITADALQPDVNWSVEHFQIFPLSFIFQLRMANLGSLTGGPFLGYYKVHIGLAFCYLEA